MKIVSTIIFLLLLAAPASTAEVEQLPDDTTVNDLLKDGWKLIATDSSDYVITYQLSKKRELITCYVNTQGEIVCFKP